MSNKDGKTQSESRPGVSPERIEKRSLSTAQHTNTLGSGKGSKQSGGGRAKTAARSTTQHTNTLGSGKGSKQSGVNKSDGGSDNSSSSQSGDKGSGGKS